MVHHFDISWGFWYANIMEENRPDLEKQLKDAKTQMSWLRQNFNDEINLLIQENRGLKEEIKTLKIPKVAPVVQEINIEKPVEISETEIEVKLETKKEEVLLEVENHNMAPDEMSSALWLFEWFICKSKDYLFRLPCTLVLLAYHIFAIQYHKHLSNRP
ncbi:hypothetical protein MJH12_11790 [bacterium]|nr:hypothetical protein [bacterium]